jgi:hypothetical protein
MNLLLTRCSPQTSANEADDATITNTQKTNLQNKD